MGWLFGRGWDQNDWTVKEFPDRTKLDSLFPDVPVFLMRIDGHAALVNETALKLAGITPQTKVVGGECVVKNGKLTGLLIDNAVDLVKAKVPEPDAKYVREMLLEAQKNCFAVGLTTVDDAGLSHQKIHTIDSLQQKGELLMRIYAMVMYDDENVAFYKQHGKYKTDFLNVRSFKVYADGALGSRGACLKESYADQHDHFGMLLHPADSFPYYARTSHDLGFQMNTHCIGDSASAWLLRSYAEVLKGKNDLRWRIEHAQVVDASDVKFFGDYSIVPSVQPAHATSDMYWAGDRLGPQRVKDAYAYETLLQQNGWLATGSDFPVENINPLYGFYAAVARKDRKGFPERGFQTENKLSRVQALRGMTIWAAKSNFEEGEKGSIEKGKFADFVILDRDIMKVSEDSLRDVSVVSTYIQGRNVFFLGR